MRHFHLHATDTEGGNAAEKWGVGVQMDAEKKINVGAKSPALIVSGLLTTPYRDRKCAARIASAI